MERGKNEIKVLVVDDNKDFADSLGNYLTESGFQVRSMTDANKALKEFRKRIYHVVLLDLKMPEISGEDLLKQMKRIDSDVSVIVITAYPSIESAVATTKLNSYAYVTKPFDMDKLVTLINEAIAERGVATAPERQILVSIGEKIRVTRKGMKLTQGQIANRTGLSRSLISRIESGSAAPSVPSLFKIAVALNVWMGDFLAEVVSQREKKD